MHDSLAPARDRISLIPIAQTAHVGGLAPRKESWILPIARGKEEWILTANRTNVNMEGQNINSILISNLLLGNNLSRN